MVIRKQEMEEIYDYFNGDMNGEIRLFEKLLVYREMLNKGTPEKVKATPHRYKQLRDLNGDIPGKSELAWLFSVYEYNKVTIYKKRVHRFTALDTTYLCIHTSPPVHSLGGFIVIKNNEEIITGEFSPYGLFFKYNNSRSSIFIPDIKPPTHEKARDFFDDFLNKYPGGYKLSNDLLTDGLVLGDAQFRTNQKKQSDSATSITLGCAHDRINNTSVFWLFDSASGDINIYAIKGFAKVVYDERSAVYLISGWYETYEKDIHKISMILPKNIEDDFVPGTTFFNLPKDQMDTEILDKLIKIAEELEEEAQTKPLIEETPMVSPRRTDVEINDEYAWCGIYILRNTNTLDQAIVKIAYGQCEVYSERTPKLIYTLKNGKDLSHSDIFGLVMKLLPTEPSMGIYIGTAPWEVTTLSFKQSVRWIHLSNTDFICLLIIDWYIAGFTHLQGINSDNPVLRFFKIKDGFFPQDWHNEDDALTLPPKLIKGQTIEPNSTNLVLESLQQRILPQIFRKKISEKTYDNCTIKTMLGIDSSEETFYEFNIVYRLPNLDEELHFRGHWNARDKKLTIYDALENPIHSKEWSKVNLYISQGTLANVIKDHCDELIAKGEEIKGMNELQKALQRQETAWKELNAASELVRQQMYDRLNSLWKIANDLIFQYRGVDMNMSLSDMLDNKVPQSSEKTLIAHKLKEAYEEAIKIKQAWIDYQNNGSIHRDESLYNSINFVIEQLKDYC